MTDLLSTIPVSYKSTRNSYTASQYLTEIKQHSVFAADFETSIKYSPSYLQSLKDELPSASKRRAYEINAILSASALDHPSHCTLTHCSIATSESDAYVFILDNRAITNLILNFLITTPIKQVWHNATYDFSRIYYFTHCMPLNYEDTQIFAKTLLNHVETYKANTGLKELMGQYYGAWAISADNFHTDSMYDEQVLKYVATDACASYKLWHLLTSYCEADNGTTSL